ncbi:DNA-binding MarR family transcriptional regulator [Streptosporangium becharense]|uniref:DNA-binding MarR family transcriptional regulator n=1 Tax=Streptosporangium becharense TaxID=1816182 RepID=A0A7W9IFX0_9ACTN|nr:MarR family transcriptional regulator [Streptosporangium becharense]MBB2909064.1 DNA-binding MarR family transcriptional regulator [Streptosporangium becharense]MBB5819918.1 DNA-binding MarR family transcriptional regulator [Streptosporangium becharense]
MSWDRFALLYARVEAELAKALQRGHGLGLSEYRALGRLAAAPGGEMRMQELAEAVGLNQSSVTRLVARLEEAGMTRRALCRDDRRGVYSVITEQGRLRLTEATPTYERSLAAALEQAGVDPILTPLVLAVRSA